MKKRYMIIICMLLVVLLAACSHKDDGQDQVKNQPVAVKTAKVQKGDFAVIKTIYGRLQPSKMTPVTIPGPGETATLKAAEGDQMEKDEEIFTIKTAAGTQSVKSPAKGTLVQLKAQEGTALSNDEPAAMIADTKDMTMELSVTGSLRKSFKKDDKHDVDFQGEKYTATVQSVAIIPGDDGLYKVKASIPNSKNTFIAGDIARLQIHVKKVQQALIIPTDAIVEKDAQSYVYVVKNDVAQKVKVKIQESQSDKSAVKANISKGDHIIIEGQLTITDDSKVKASEGQE